MKKDKKISVDKKSQGGRSRLSPVCPQKGEKKKRK